MISHQISRGFKQLPNRQNFMCLSQALDYFETILNIKWKAYQEMDLSMFHNCCAWTYTISFDSVPEHSFSCDPSDANQFQKPNVY